MPELKEYTAAQVSTHNTFDDLWVIYNGNVYNITNYIYEHPGGDEVILGVAGSDATESFNDIGHSDDAHEIMRTLQVGSLKGGIVKEIKSQNHGDIELTKLYFPFVAISVVLLSVVAYFVNRKFF